MDTKAERFLPSAGEIFEPNDRLGRVGRNHLGLEP